VMSSFKRCHTMNKNLLLHSLYRVSVILLFIFSDGHFTPKTANYSGFLYVSQSDRDCSVTADFSPASEAFGFKGYDVQLIGLSNGYKIIEERKNLQYTCVVSSTRNFLLLIVTSL